jgi:hypothetical protein
MGRGVRCSVRAGNHAITSSSSGVSSGCGCGSRIDSPPGRHPRSTKANRLLIIVEDLYRTSLRSDRNVASRMVPEVVIVFSTPSPFG